MTAEALPAELRRAICQLARTPRLLVASDYDGTLAPIVSDPEQARPLPESVNALRSLASLHETTSAVISGRALRDLATLRANLGAAAEANKAGWPAWFNPEPWTSLDANAVSGHVAAPAASTA